MRAALVVGDADWDGAVEPTTPGGSLSRFGGSVVGTASDAESRRGGASAAYSRAGGRVAGQTRRGGVVAGSVSTGGFIVATGEGEA